MPSCGRRTVSLLSLLLCIVLLSTPVFAADEYSSDDYLDEPIEGEIPSGEVGPDTEVAASVSDSGSFYWFFLKLAGGLGVVTLAIWGIGKLLNKTGMGTGGNKFMEVHSTLALSRDQYLRIARVGNRFMVLGITGESINKICEIEDPELIQELKLEGGSDEESDEKSEDFSGILRRFLGGADHSFQKSDGEQNLGDLQQKLNDLKASGEADG